MKTCIVQIFVVAVFGCLFLWGCSISFSNISTHGSASDLVDQDQEASPDVKPDINLSLPVKAV